jgi:hypothetical protein
MMAARQRRIGLSFDGQVVAATILQGDLAFKSEKLTLSFAGPKPPVAQRSALRHKALGPHEPEL